MIRRGKSEGWLTAPVSSLKTFATYNHVEFHDVSVRETPDRGAALIADRALEGDGTVLVTVPPSMVLSKETIQLHAKSDSHFREILDAVGEFGRSTRNSILIFLLVQATHNCPDLNEKIGPPSAYANYIKYLPLENLPTFWTDAELELLTGTSLLPATTAKLNSLYREFEYLRSATESIPWCQRCWWDEVDGLLQFDDWKQVDAMYRSRALELPGAGDAMVPCVDMANHASGSATVARYEADGDGNAFLLLRDGKTVGAGEEIFITYGDEKGGCEMIFSYGFMEEQMTTAGTLFLDLDVPEDDPLRRVKKAVSTSAPGVRISEDGGHVTWDSDFIWLVVVNEEDGLHFQLAQTTDGEQELQATWCEEELPEGDGLGKRLRQHPQWDVFELRAVSIIQDRVQSQLELLQEFEATTDKKDGGSPGVREGAKRLSQRLRNVEGGLLKAALRHLELETNRLVKSDSVVRYLQLQGTADSEPMEDDFS